jgi:hypothetical protein
LKISQWERECVTRGIFRERERNESKAERGESFEESTSSVVREGN